MPYKMSWLVEKRILYTQMSGLVTSEEIRSQNREMEEYAQHSELLLHTITDDTYSTGFDMKLRDLQKTQFVDIHNLGWAICVSPSKMNRFFASVITQLSQKRGRQFSTLEEAVSFLQEMDDTLPPIPMPIKANSA